jgi:hypothetical protein
VAKGSLSRLRKAQAEIKDRAELFLANWLKENKASGAEVKELTRLCEEYRSHDPDNEDVDLWDYVEAADDILQVVPEGVDDYWCNRIEEMLNTADLKRIRQCLSCKRWLYALDPRQKHCNDECRDRYRMKTTAYKERKREDMRKLRKIEKERKQAEKAYRAEQETKDAASRKKTQSKHNYM